MTSEGQTATSIVNKTNKMTADGTTDQFWCNDNISQLRDPNVMIQSSSTYIDTSLPTQRRSNPQISSPRFFRFFFFSSAASAAASVTAAVPSFESLFPAFVFFSTTLTAIHLLALRRSRNRRLKVVGSFELSSSLWSLGGDHRLCTNSEVDEIIVGLPKSSDGMETEQSNKVRSFADRLAFRAAKRGWRVYLQDEHGTSTEVVDHMIAPGLSKSARQGNIDSYAAVENMHEVRCADLVLLVFLPHCNQRTQCST
ncbi:uncharacterized protein [Henckelia pumila]|uniref:uncharacterized protein n=1 Tax=Henckelia pumila TaxID=405737 RepID=UPI003C6DDD06